MPRLPVTLRSWGCARFSPPPACLRTYPEPAIGTHNSPARTRILSCNLAPRGGLSLSRSIGLYALFRYTVYGSALGGPLPPLLLLRPVCFCPPIFVAPPGPVCLYPRLRSARVPFIFVREATSPTSRLHPSHPCDVPVFEVDHRERRRGFCGFRSRVPRELVPDIVVRFSYVQPPKTHTPAPLTIHHPGWSWVVLGPGTDDTDDATPRISPCCLL